MRFSIATAYIDPAELVPIARAADEAGYHALALADHVVNLETLATPYPYTDDGQRRWDPFTPWVDPWVTIGALGAVTERLRFFTNVYVMPMRDPFTVAKQVATASVLSGGRVSLGVGMGWCEEEFDLLGEPFGRRGARADEMLTLLADLWTGGWVEHHGEFYDVPRLEMTPAPPGPVSVYVGGMSGPAIRRAARHDG
ncbi:MAG: TIGR03619 family F420-dependent LLM class oxidoreductase, partial [Acidimicrobiia bacterium]|nr:TIGR03619 family F420-dependent LLM class oxidoreductase [Acidimicrobiia bacterium]